MKIKLADTAQRINPSPTLALNARATALRAKGKDIISLSVGEPDFDTPEYIKEAAIKAIRDGKTKYTAIDGTPALKKAVQTKFLRDNKLSYEPEQIIVSPGAKNAIFNACMALFDPGDEAIIPAPYWVSYPDIVKITGAKPVIIQTDIAQSYKITPGQLEAAITAKTKLFIINSPSNPAGTVYSAQELKTLAEVLLKHPQIIILTDDIYEHIWWYDEPFADILMVCPELYERTIVVNGASKAYAMTGWRIGYSAGPAAIIAAMKKIQSQSTSNPCSISQAATVAALNGPQDCLREMVVAFKQRHDYLFGALSEIEGIKVIPSDGTFYCFPDFQEIIAKSANIKSDMDLSELFLNEAEVAMVPGSAFGCPGAIRISYAVSLEMLKEAVERIKTVLN
jgi:aspartate aminotransferase